MVSLNGGTPKTSISIGFAIINHPFWGTPIFGNIHIYTLTCSLQLFLHQKQKWIESFHFMEESDGWMLIESPNVGRLLEEVEGHFDQLHESFHVVIMYR